FETFLYSAGFSGLTTSATVLRRTDLPLLFKNGDALCLLAGAALSAVTATPYAMSADFAMRKDTTSGGLQPRSAATTGGHADMPRSIVRTGGHQYGKRSVRRLAQAAAAVASGGCQVQGRSSAMRRAG